MYNVAPQLEAAAASLGGVGARNAGNTVGYCGEFHAANELLNPNPGYGTGDLKFTPAVRPRTGQVVPPCSNYGQMFNVKLNSYV